MTAVAPTRPHVSRVFAAWAATSGVLLLGWLVVCPPVSFLLTFGTWGAAPSPVLLLAVCAIIVAGVSVAAVLTAAVWRRATNTPAPILVALLPPLLLGVFTMFAVELGLPAFAAARWPTSALLLTVVVVAAAAPVLFFSRNGALIIAGIVALGVGVSSVAAVSVIGLAEREAQATADQLAALQEDTAWRESTTQSYREAGLFPLTTDADGWRATSILISPRAQITTASSPNGLTAEITAFHPDDVGDQIASSAAPCTFVQRPGDAPLSAENEHPAWCVEGENEWRNATGASVAFFLPDGRFATVSAENAADADAVRGALRTLTLDEVDRVIAPAWVDSASPPDVYVSDPRL